MKTEWVLVRGGTLPPLPCCAFQEKKESLKKAVSLKKKLKGVEWHRRQSEREKQMKVVKGAQPCKFYIHGSCRAVSRGRGG